MYTLVDRGREGVCRRRGTNVTATQQEERYLGGCGSGLHSSWVTVALASAPKLLIHREVRDKMVPVLPVELFWFFT